MLYYLIKLTVNNETRFYFNQRTLVRHRALAHPFPSAELAELSFRKSRFKDYEYKLVEDYRDY